VVVFELNCIIKVAFVLNAILKIVENVCTIKILFTYLIIIVTICNFYILCYSIKFAYISVTMFSQ